MNPQRFLVIIIITLLMAGLSGCSPDSPESKPADNPGQKPKAPTELKTMGAELDTIIAELDKKLKQENANPMQQNIQLNPIEEKLDQNSQSQSLSQPLQPGQTQSNNKQSQDEESQDGQPNNRSSKSSSGEQSQGQPPSTQPTQKTAEQKGAEDWQIEFTTLRGLHTNWNSVMPGVVQAGMSSEARTQFTMSLDKLTQEINKQQPESSLAAALDLYKYYADMVHSFQTSTPAEFYQVKYEIMSVIWAGSQNNWALAEEHVPKMREHWLYLGAQAQGIDSKMLDKTEFAIMDLEQAVRNKQSDLTMIKGEVAMTNLQSLEAKLSNKQNQSGQQSSEEGQRKN